MGASEEPGKKICLGEGIVGHYLWYLVIVVIFTELGGAKPRGQMVLWSVDIS